MGHYYRSGFIINHFSSRAITRLLSWRVLRGGQERTGQESYWWSILRCGRADISCK